jgi:hypothetical protein
MPKTKFQKQQEAIERKRAFLHVYRERYHKIFASQEQITKQLGTEAAQQRLTEAEQSFKRACAEAHVDAYGNPL